MALYAEYPLTPSGQSTHRSAVGAGPHDLADNLTFVTGAEGSDQPSFTSPGYTWNPPDDLVNEEPADEPYDVIDDRIAPVDGPTPSNIVVGAGPFSRSRGQDVVQLPPD